jgi:hypothetical protein
MDNKMHCTEKVNYLVYEDFYIPGALSSCLIGHEAGGPQNQFERCAEEKNPITCHESNFYSSIVHPIA